MHDTEAIRVEQSGQRREVNFERIDEDKLVFNGHLNQSHFGEEGLFPVELGIDGVAIAAKGPLHEGCKVSGGCYRLMQDP